MSTRKSAPRRRSAQGNRQKTLWYNNQSAPASVVTGASGVFELTDLSGLPPAVEGGFTVRRMIIRITARVNSNQQDSFGAFGVVVMPRSSLATPPNAIVDLLDWYYHVNWWVRTDSITTIYTLGDVDIRTSRLVRGEDRTLLSVNSVNSSAGTGITYSVACRLLLGYP